MEETSYMTRQERFDRLFARLMLPENFERRNPAIFSDEDIEIAKCVEDMKKILESFNNGTATVFDEIKFDNRYSAVIKIFEKNGWK